MKMRIMKWMKSQIQMERRISTDELLAGIVLLFIHFMIFVFLSILTLNCRPTGK